MLNSDVAVNPFIIDLFGPGSSQAGSSGI